MTSPDSKDYIGTELMRVATGHVDGFVGETARVMVDDANREINEGDRVTPASEQHIRSLLLSVRWTRHRDRKPYHGGP